ncbi:hypothetical protein F4677DRAFT_156073 [Hypoxylon crocopeplum]|nr:hypothetical protein F4677DRAFT_156073 [Hypoxylon crocopeplum]
MDYGGSRPQHAGGNGQRRPRTRLSGPLFILLLLISITLLPSYFKTADKESKWRDPDMTLVYDDLDFTDAMEVFWVGCREILLDNADFDLWFDDVALNDVVISTMIDALPLGYHADQKGDDYITLPRIEKVITTRATRLAKAKAEFTGFLAARDQILRDVISNGTLWHYHSMGGDEIGLADARTSSLEDYDQAVLKITKGMVQKLFQIHSDLWTQNGIGEDMAKHIAAARKLVDNARGFERQGVQKLKMKSAKGSLWDRKTQGDVLWQLSLRMVKLQNQHNRMTRALEVARDRLDAGEKTRTTQGQIQYWRRNTRYILNNWHRMIMNSQHGILFSIRRRELKAAEDLSYLELIVLWDYWKGRNCGGTSCYDADGNIARLLRIIRMQWKPLAFRAKDELEWARYRRGERRKVWRGVYEKACCVESTIADFLKFAPYGSIKEEREIDTRLKSVK